MKMMEVIKTKEGYIAHGHKIVVSGKTEEEATRKFKEAFALQSAVVKLMKFAETGSF